MKNNPETPLFIWAGGKRKMLKHYLPLLPSRIDAYCEPFFGGGAMFTHVMCHHKPRRVIINDVNSSLMSIYRELRDNHGEFVRHASELEAQFLPLSKEQRKKFYMNLRHRHAYHFSEMSSTEEAATLFFLMKTSFNGIYQHNNNTNGRFGTPAGLLNQTDKVFDRDRVLWWHQALQGVTILSEDWAEVVKWVDDSFFTFLDPPYRGCFTSYGQQFEDHHQAQLLKWAASQKNVMFCNRELGDGFWKEHNCGLNVSEFDVTYTAGRRKKEDDGTFSAKKAKEILLWQRT